MPFLLSLFQLHHVSLVIWLTHLLHTAAICFTGLSPGVETDVVNVTSGFLNSLLNFNGHHYNNIVFGKRLKASFESVLSQYSEPVEEVCMKVLHVFKFFSHSLQFLF